MNLDERTDAIKDELWEKTAPGLDKAAYNLRAGDKLLSPALAKIFLDKIACAHAPILARFCFEKKGFDDLDWVYLADVIDNMAERHRMEIELQQERISMSMEGE